MAQYFLYKQYCIFYTRKIVKNTRYNFYNLEWERIFDINKNISVVSFSASWHGRCKTFMPMLERLSEETKYSNVAFYNVNIDKSKEITKGDSICSIPVTKIIQNGKIVGIVFESFKDYLTQKNKLNY